MARKEIKGPISDSTLNNTNHNFKELYDGFNNVVDEVSNKAYAQVVDAAKINWKDPVDTMDDLPSNALEGDTRMTREKGIVYRFDGSSWNEIQEIDVGPVNEVDSRLSSQLAQKVDLQRETITYNIPTDYPDWQSAVDELSEFKVKNGVELVINFESGFEIESGLLVTNGNYNHFRVTSDDEVVNLGDGYIGVNYDVGGVNVDIDSYLLIGVNASMPVLDCIIDMRGFGSVGYYAATSSTGYIAPNCGVLNAPFVGIEARASIISAEFSIVDGCYYGYRAQQGGTVFAQNGKADNCTCAMLASRGGTIIFSGGSAKDSIEFGARAQRSRIVAIATIFNGAKGIAINASDGSIISAASSEIKNSPGRAIQAQSASDISCVGIQVDNCSKGLKATNGSKIVATYGVINNIEGDSIECESGSAIVISNSSVINSGGNALIARDSSAIEANGTDCSHPEGVGTVAYGGSIINFTDGTCVGAGGSAISALSGSRIVARGAIVHNSGSQTAAINSQSGSHVDATNTDTGGSASHGLNVFEGGIISARGSTDTPAQPPNQLTSRGIIFK